MPQFGYLSRIDDTLGSDKSGGNTMITWERIFLMNTSRYLLFTLAAFGAFLAVALADPTDDVLNRLNVDNMQTRLTSEMPSASTEGLHPRQQQETRKPQKETKTQKSAKPQATAEHVDHTSVLGPSSPIFNYQASTIVTQRARVNFTAAMAKNDLRKLQFVERVLATNPEGRFDARFSMYGYSNHNVSDTLAGFVIAFWEMANDQDASAHPSGIRQVRSKMNELLLSKSTGKTYSDAEKQYLSEYLKLLAVACTDALNETHDPAAVQNGRNLVYQVGLKLGVDLRRLALTNSGFRNI
jgi:hypothetical protein